jgi:hypothetical protein
LSARRNLRYPVSTVVATNLPIAFDLGLRWADISVAHTDQGSAGSGKNMHLRSSVCVSKRYAARDQVGAPTFNFL